MGEGKPEKVKKHICVGLLAHVDGGKTTLSEAILYTCGKTRRLGRVDYKDTFLDTGAMERERGITIFSKEARLTLGDWEVTFLDTPGHGDFGAETERVIAVLDYCVLVISASQGVRGNTLTLWKLLEKQGIPVFLFINKMDWPGADKGELLKQLGERLSDACVDIRAEDYKETLAMCHESLLDEYMKSGDIGPDSIRRAVKRRWIFPCYFGSALHMEGVRDLLEGMEGYMQPPLYRNEFGARVYKISREGNHRLTHMKITGGSLGVKEGLPPWGKADQIRLYSGEKYTLTDRVYAGEICAVAGLEGIGAGKGIGAENGDATYDLQPVLTYEVIPREGADVFRLRESLRILEEELPEIHPDWKEEGGPISIRVMGRMQLEVVERILGERFGMKVSFGPGSILYLESITAGVRGRGCGSGGAVEVEILLEPGKAGSGLVFDSSVIRLPWETGCQNLSVEGIGKKLPMGPRGFGLTDMILKVERVKGSKRPSGDEELWQALEMALCQALYRGWQEGKMVLLEPRYRFRMELPLPSLGRAMHDIQQKKGRMEPVITQGDMAVLEGEVPAAALENYQEEVWNYTGGMGRLWYCLAGYGPCHNPEEVVGASSFSPMEDGRYRRALRDGLLDVGEKEAREDTLPGPGLDGERELEEIFARTYKSNKRTREGAALAWKRKRDFSAGDKHPEKTASPTDAATSGQDGILREEYLLVDGYNIIFAWPELKLLAKDNLEGARGRLADILCDYQGHTGYRVILVFDAYRVKDNPGSVISYHNIDVVYTKTAQTADQYIEMTAHGLKWKSRVWVATSDALEQLIVWGQGAMRMSAGELEERIRETGRKGLEHFHDSQSHERNYIPAHLLPDQKEGEECD